MILFGTGHRPDKLGGWDERNSSLALAVKAAVEKKLLELHPELVISGMALGFDMWLAEACIKLSIPFDAYVPFEGQDSVWPMFSRTRYKSILYEARRTVVVSSGGYAAWKMQTRNQRMVDDADQGLACYDGTKGGTRNCVTYAQLHGVYLHIINPRELES